MKHYIEPREGTPIQSKMQLPEKLRELRVNSGYTQQQVDTIFLAAATAANQARIPLARMVVQIIKKTHGKLVSGG